MCLGQKLNREKTSIFFSKATSEGTREEISNFLGVPEVKEYATYLGLPVVVGRNKKVSLRYIKEKIWNKLQGWKEKLLSQAGIEVLLKAVVQAIKYDLRRGAWIETRSSVQQVVTSQITS